MLICFCFEIKKSAPKFECLVSSTRNFPLIVELDSCRCIHGYTRLLLLSNPETLQLHQAQSFRAFYFFDTITLSLYFISFSFDSSVINIGINGHSKHSSASRIWLKLNFVGRGWICINRSSSSNFDHLTIGNGVRIDRHVKLGSRWNNILPCR